MSEDMLSKTFFKFNTPNTLSIYGGSHDMLDQAEELCNRYELLFSRTNPTSALYQINHAAGRSVDVDAELARFIETALSYCEKSGGLFDITMGSVVRLWDFKQGVIPSHDAIERALCHVNYQNVQVCNNSIMLSDPDATLDLGGIAKGYIADQLVSFLQFHGATGGIVNLGGNVAVFGTKPDGTAWNIGIRSPKPYQNLGEEESFALVSIQEGSVVTSGLYERAFVEDNRLYHHILDPTTGYPVQTDVLSATIVASNSLDADGFTTSLVLMGADKALAFIESDPNMEAVLVTTEGDVLATSKIGSEVPFTLVERDQ